MLGVIFTGCPRRARPLALVMLASGASDVGGRVLWRRVGQRQFVSAEKAAGKVGTRGFGLVLLL